MAKQNQPSIPMSPVKSSAADSCGFDKERGVLAVKYKGGKTYQFEGATQQDYDELINAKSFGKHLHGMKPKLSAYEED